MKILFVCTANSCRSQMAEAWARHLFPEGWEVHSAGLLIYRITSRTRAAMKEVGVGMEGQKPKTFDRFNLDSFDRIVTLSEEARRYLPSLEHPDRHLPRPITDPMSARGTDEEVTEAFRQGREEIRKIVTSLLPSDNPQKDA